MKTMTFSGRTMREAIALAKARFGAEVDILDSGAVGDEVQVTVVVPMARSARRRQALAQVSASINALAARTAVQVPAPAASPAADSASAAPAASVSAASAAAQTGAATAKTGSAAEPRKAGRPAAESWPDTAASVAAARNDAGMAGMGSTPQADTAKNSPAEAGRDTKAAATAAAEGTGAATPPGRTPRGVKGRRKRQAEADMATPTQTAEETMAVVGTAVAPLMPAAPVADYLAAAANSVTLAAANDEVVAEPVGSPAPVAESVRAADSQNGSLAAAANDNDTSMQPSATDASIVAGAPEAASPVPGALPDIAAGMPLSTLDFQRVREQQRAENASSVTAPAASIPPAVGVPDFAALLEQQRQGIPIDLSALQMPGQGAGATVMKQPSGAPVAGAQPPGAQFSGSQPAGFLQPGMAQSAGTQSAGAQPVGTQPAGARPAGTQSAGAGAGATAPAILRGYADHAAEAAAHAARQPRSRLWQMVDSARRMLGMGRLRRRALWHDVDAALMSQAAAAQVSGAAAVLPGPVQGASGAQAGLVQPGTAMTGFGEASPLSLASTLAGGLGDWPSITLPSELSGTGELPAGQAGWTAHDGPGWFEATRRRPGQMRLLRNLLGCQFSPALARTLVELLPADYAEAQADEWLRQMLMRALASVNRGAGQVVEGERTLFDEGGVFALIGPTGVGKTTSIAKIAAHHVLRHGPRSLALITADVYRIGAQEQLRAFGRMLGVPVQVAQDRDVLQQLLKEHEQSRLVLIDTAGIGQRDDRVSQLTSALEVSQVRRVLVMNAAAQPGSIEEVLGAFGARDTAGVLLSKVDEAVGLGACLDALVRHRLPLLGYADGQRVPEDYHAVDFSRLVGLALDRKTVSRFTALKMTDSEMRNLFEDAHV